MTRLAAGVGEECSIPRNGATIGDAGAGHGRTGGVVLTLLRPTPQERPGTGRVQP